ncbi:MAG: nucleotidyltransferase family protein [Nitrospira sp.]|nr:nucleotidyltransferase family protein [Nitrospira sp.]
MSIYDTQVRSLRAEELLLILCVHGSKHVWEELKWVCDVTELIRAQQIGWMRLLQLAED